MTHRPDNLLHPSIIITNAKGMVYHPGSRSFSIEASMLGATKVEPSRVYNDACDEGFTLVSHRTGDEVIVALDRVDYNGDDVLAWEYASIWPRGANIRLSVFND